VPSVDVYETPALAAGGKAWASFDNPTSMEVPLVFRVVASQGDALRVMLPTRPNGATGWIKGSDVSLAEDQFRAQVQLGAHQLTVWNGNDVIEQTTVAVGTPSAPTPTGDFYLTELIDTHNPGGAYGPYAFGLSAYSDVYTEFAGGPGQIGMHGTNAPGALGTDASHGCIRVENDVITKLASELPVGSQIVVTP
jgi:lipoprotein-anchoring transpeptidase ErfK/SrfK